MIHIKGVDKAFKSVSPIRDLSLNVVAGEVVGLLGPNGAGKSTTINMLLGFLRPDAGTVRIAGKDTYMNHE